MDSPDSTTPHIVMNGHHLTAEVTEGHATRPESLIRPLSLTQGAVQEPAVESSISPSDLVRPQESQSADSSDLIGAADSQSPAPAASALQPGERECRVCKDKASGVHFGVWSCEGCKGFFKREHLPNGALKVHECGAQTETGQLCDITPRTRNRCRACRLRKCIAVGMDRNEIKLGRRKKKELLLAKQQRSAALKRVKPSLLVSLSVGQPSGLECRLGVVFERADLALRAMRVFCQSPHLGLSANHIGEISEALVHKMLLSSQWDVNKLQDYEMQDFDWSLLIQDLPDCTDNDLAYEFHRIQILSQIQSASLRLLLETVGLPAVIGHEGDSSQLLTSEDLDFLRASCQAMMLALTLGGIDDADQTTIVSRTQRHLSQSGNPEIRKLYQNFIPKVKSCGKKLQQTEVGSADRLLVALVLITCKDKLGENKFFQSDEMRRFIEYAVEKITDPKYTQVVRLWREDLRTEQMKALKGFVPKPPSNSYLVSQNIPTPEVKLPEALKKNIIISRLQEEKNLKSANKHCKKQHQSIRRLEAHETFPPHLSRRNSQEFFTPMPISDNDMFPPNLVISPTLGITGYDHHHSLGTSPCEILTPSDIHNKFISPGQSLQSPSCIFPPPVYTPHTPNVSPQFSPQFANQFGPQPPLKDTISPMYHNNNFIQGSKYS